MSQVQELKTRWLSLAAQEQYPKTPEITQELDSLEQQIKELSGEEIELELKIERFANVE